MTRIAALIALALSLLAPGAASALEPCLPCHQEKTGRHQERGEPPEEPEERAPAALSSEDELKALKNKYDGGVLSEEQYTKEKAKVLEKMK